MNIDDIFDRAKYAVNMAAKKTEDVVELSKLKLESARISRDISDLYEKLGRSVYDAHKGVVSNQDFTDAVCDEIDEMLKTLADLNNEIADRKNQVICSACGAANQKENLYCAQCGAKIRETYDSCCCEDETDASEEESCGCGCKCNCKEEAPEEPKAEETDAPAENDETKPEE